jgi:hypothetical protein
MTHDKLNIVACGVAIAVGVLAAALNPLPSPQVFTSIPITWTGVPAVRPVGDLPPVVRDIESHLLAGNPYRDPDDLVGWVHEGTHGINSVLRDTYRCPAFYVLQDRAALIQEPGTTLSTVAGYIPPSLQGGVYNLYFYQQEPYWQDKPLCRLFDELSAYANGANARMALGIADRGETVRYALELAVYSMCVPQAAQSTDPQMREFLKYQTGRVMKIIISSGSPRDWEYIKKLRSAPDAENLRRFIRRYFGTAWAREELGL